MSSAHSESSVSDITTNYQGGDCCTWGTFWLYPSALHIQGSQRLGASAHPYVNESMSQRTNVWHQQVGASPVGPDPNTTLRPPQPLHYVNESMRLKLDQILARPSDPPAPALGDKLGGAAMGEVSPFSALALSRLSSPVIRSITQEHDTPT